MTAACDSCARPSVIFMRYSGQHLCQDHFLDLIRRRVRKEVRSQRLLVGRKTIGVAVSGGKDSLLALALLHEIVEPFKDKELTAITVDEGIEGYRPSSVGIARKVAGDLGVRWDLTSFKDLFGTDLDTMVKASGIGPCTICGILRRNALNRAAVRTGSEVLITGHNLDDMAQTVLMNVLGADIHRFARMGPHLDPLPGFVPRGIPLRTTPETETYLAAHLLGIPLYEVECPYAVSAHRGVFSDLLLRAERETPGTRHSLLSFHEKVSPLIARMNSETRRCPGCGEPIVLNGEVELCKACQLLEELGVGK
ncbi:MAG: ATP-binding protein [Thermoplasmatota archaeon]